MEKTTIAENLLPLVEAVERATGLRPHLSTTIRWSTRGSAGIRLQTQVVGSRRFTTVPWVQQYIHAVTEAKNGSSVMMATPRQQEQAAKKSAKKLADRLSRSTK